MTVAVVACAVMAVLLWSPARPRRLPMSGRVGSRASPGAARRQTTSGRGTPPRTGRPRADVQDVADALVLVALALRAGLPVVESLEQAAATVRSPVSRDLSAVAAALRWGRATVVAWGYADPVWRAAALAFQMAESTGAGAADLIDAAAQRLREEQERDRERRAARAGVLLVLPLGFGFLPAFACTAVIPLVVVLADGVLGAP